MNDRLYVIETTNDLIKQYFSSYKYYQTLAADAREEQFERDFKNQVDKIISAIVKFIETYAVEDLITIWEFFNTKLFNNLNEHDTKVANKLEADVFKIYLANCVQNKNLSESTRFFELMAPIITDQPPWKEWFCLPYIPEPQKNEKYQNYFSKQWHEILFISLHNFITNRIDLLCKPPLVGWNSECMGECSNPAARAHTSLRHSVTTILMDDFAIIAQQSPGKSQQSRLSLKNMFRNITTRRRSGADD